VVRALQGPTIPARLLNYFGTSVSTNIGERSELAFAAANDYDRHVPGAVGDEVPRVCKSFYRTDILPVLTENLRLLTLKYF
jgi:hypothetical protein